MRPGEHIVLSEFTRLVLAIVVIGGLGGCERTEGDVEAPSPYLQAAERAGRWLQDQADPGRLDAIPDEIGRDSAFSAGLGEGAAGRIVFFLELFAATGDSSYLSSAHAEGDAAIATTRDGTGPLGLYDGLPGTAFALTELAKVSSGGSQYRHAAEVRFERVVALAERIGDAARWGSANDVIAGSAGVGLSLLYAAREFGRTDFLQAAEAAGRALIASAEETDKGVRWQRFTDRELNLPNFSHGTAGVAYFLAELSEDTGDDTFLDEAEGGAQYLIAVADRSDRLFLVPYGIPSEGYVTKYDVGWAHGPSGTARLFYKLWRLTGERRYRDIVDANARSILAAGVPGASTDTLRWAGPLRADRRFGLAGIIPFLIDWHRNSGGAAYLNTARTSADTILALATSAESGLQWTVPRLGFQGEGNATYTGYFYGSAGMGLALLEMYYAETGEEPSIRLPDDPFGKE